MVTPAELRTLMKDMSEGIDDEMMNKAAEFCNLMEFTPQSAISPGFNEDWDDYPEISELCSAYADFRFVPGDDSGKTVPPPRDGIFAWRNIDGDGSCTVEIRTAWMGAHAVCSTFLLG